MPTLQTVSRQNLLHTPHGFCFRMKAPKRHRDYFNRREFKKSLQTTDLKEAQKRALLLTVQIDDFITRLDILKGYRMSRLPFFSEIKIAEVDVSFAGIKFEVSKQIHCTPRLKRKRTVKFLRLLVKSIRNCLNSHQPLMLFRAYLYH